MPCPQDPDISTRRAANEIRCGRDCRTFFYMLVLAYAASLLIYNVAAAFGAG
ncbi:hypothetical protein [Bradyrhizobium canariense]|uniref:hypothetical protein n=1 Tax=Bradyrhizobium canariense TaxID=255045 RepID=UPI001B8A31D7|nr:hypothetical protein [Bradyrhizobium canariense]MBR0952392.1 hypothetical protein [Bradyrhizobium canariense]